MRNSTRIIMGVLLAALALVLVTKTAMAQDPVKVAPEIYKVLLENDQVRVLEFRLKPGGKSPMHSHPANVIYSLTDSKLKLTTSDGKSSEVDLKAGQATWSDAVTHSVDNLGNTEAHGLVIELK